MGTRRMAAAVAFGTCLSTVAPVAAQEDGSEFRSCSHVMGSEVCTWVRMSGDTVLELGASVPLALIEGAPADAPMLWPPDQLGVVLLPDQARRALGLDHLGINWEAHGHPPPPFMTPHFDFHFYNTSQGRVQAIDCSDLAKPARLPEGYELPDIVHPEAGMLVGLCVPAMGMHAMPAEDVAGTELFGGSMVVGYYRQAPIFFEPMLSQALLMKRADFTLPMPVVEDLPEGVRYPRAFRAEYDAEGQRYRFIFGGFAEG
ncbi:MAG TPA: hypothetical protein VK849_05950 [Longimicrobiales bacterium]|nr:hypothetical protein [Longimicrobiales bacterium]